MAKPFYWVRGEDLRREGFFEMALSEGVDGMRLEFHPEDDKPFKWVDIETGEVCGAYNIVFTCPPNCP